MDLKQYTSLPSSYYTLQCSEEEMLSQMDPALLGSHHYLVSGLNEKQMSPVEAASIEHPLQSYGRTYPLQIPSATSMMFDHHQNWTYTSDSYRPPRYMSPNGHFGGTISEASSSTDFAPSPETSGYAVPYPNSPANLQNSYVYRGIDRPVTEHMPWQPHSQPSYPPTSSSLHHQLVHPSQSLVYSLKDLEFTSQEELNMEESLHELETIEVKRPSHIFEPEEVELSGFGPSNPGLVLASTPSLSTPSGSMDVNDDEIFNEDESVPADNDSDSDYQAQRKRRGRGRASISQSARGLRSPRRVTQQILSSNAKVRKPTLGHARRTSKTKPLGPTTANRGNTNGKADRYFPCTFHAFGCDATFGNKNEWKRHVASQHLRLGYYRCNLGDCDPDTGAYVGSGRRQSNKDVKIYNDFNRKDLFTQHCRRMHGPARNSVNSKATREEELAFEAELEGIRQRCWRVRRKAPARSICGFCSRVFEASGEEGSEERAWEERMEHVGRHYEKDNIDIENETIDDDLVEWGLQTEVFYITPSGKPWLVDYVYTKDEENKQGKPRELTRRGRRHPARSISNHHEQREDNSDEDAYGEDE